MYRRIQMTVVLAHERIRYRVKIAIEPCTHLQESGLENLLVDVSEIVRTSHFDLIEVRVGCVTIDCYIDTDSRNFAEIQNHEHALMRETKFASTVCLLACMHVCMSVCVYAHHVIFLFAALAWAASVSHKHQIPCDNDARVSDNAQEATKSSLHQRRERHSPWCSSTLGSKNTSLMRLPERRIMVIRLHAQPRQT